MLDLAVVAWIVLFAASGFFRGLTAQVLSLVGVAAGVVVGAAVAPRLLSDDYSPWVPFASLVGAALGALLVGLLAGSVGGNARNLLAGRPVLVVADRAGGAAAGAVLGVALAWATAVLLLHQPALGLRAEIRDSALLAAFVRAVPPEPVLRTLQRFDPLPLLPGSGPESLPAPDASIVANPSARRAAQSVVKIEGTSCGLGVQGSGWVVRGGYVATNAHVVSGQRDTRVAAPGGHTRDATLVYLDARNDVAILRVPGLATRRLAVDVGGSFPRAAVVLGYPRDGALTATAATAGAPRTVVAPDAYDENPGPRVVMPLRGRVQPGESGGPVVDSRGRVVGMIFGGARSGGGGFATPVGLVLRGLSGPLRALPAGPCVG